LPWIGDSDLLLDEVEEFLTGIRRGPDPDRVLATVLFTDIVGSTERAAALGDRRWRDLCSLRITWRPPPARALAGARDRHRRRWLHGCLRRARPCDRLCVRDPRRGAHARCGDPRRPAHRRVRTNWREARRTRCPH